MVVASAAFKPEEESSADEIVVWSDMDANGLVIWYRRLLLMYKSFETKLVQFQSAVRPILQRFRPDSVKLRRLLVLTRENFWRTVSKLEKKKETLDGSL